MTHKGPSTNPAAMRMRRYRQRLKHGLRFWRVPLYSDWRDALTELGLITEAEGADAAKLSAAIGDFSDAALNEALRQQRYANAALPKPVVSDSGKETDIDEQPDNQRPRRHAVRRARRA
jgi:hypothetical protein